MKNICQAEWCEKESVCSGYCGRHYRQILTWGEVRRSRGDKNEIVLHDDYAEIVLYDINYNEKARAIIDLNDVERCKAYKWSLRSDGYVSAKINGKGVKLHRFIKDTPKGKHTDHENRNKLDNRKSNLIICDQSQNNKNKGKYKNNTTGRRGITRKDGNFQADLRFNGKDHYLGYFKNFEDAVKAREDAEIKFYGHVLNDV